MSPARVALVLDSAPRLRPALGAVARLAARLEGELSAVFVEDEGLLHWASLPFTREVGFPTASRREFDAEAMARALRAGAEGLRRQLESAALGASVPLRFRVSRGALLGELLRAAAEADLVVAESACLEPLACRLTAIVRAGAPPGAFEGLAELAEQMLADVDVVLLGAGPPGGDGEQLLRERLSRRRAERVRLLRAARDEDLRRLLTGRA